MVLDGGIANARWFIKVTLSVTEETGYPISSSLGAPGRPRKPYQLFPGMLSAGGALPVFNELEKNNMTSNRVCLIYCSLLFYL